MLGKHASWFSSELSKIQLRLNEHFHSEFPFVNEVLEYNLSSGGKRIRPLLTVLCARLCGCDDEGVYDLSVIPEYLHSASIMHDDVIDDGLTRRGKPATHKIWGNKITILTGDFLYARAIELATRFNKLSIASEIANTVLLMAEGELLQLQQSNTKAYNEQIYFDIIYRKTATLIATSCKIGALYATEDKRKINALYEYGRCIGIAFQLVDDLLDYTKDANKTGKTRCSDISEGKITLPLIIALNNSKGEESERLKALIGRKLDETDATWICEYMESLGINSAILSQASNYIKDAKTSLEVFGKSNYREILTDLADFILQREH